MMYAGHMKKIMNKALDPPISRILQSLIDKHILPKIEAICLIEAERARSKVTIYFGYKFQSNDIFGDDIDELNINGEAEFISPKRIEWIYPEYDGTDPIRCIFNGFDFHVIRRTLYNTIKSLKEHGYTVTSDVMYFVASSNRCKYSENTNYIGRMTISWDN